VQPELAKRAGHAPEGVLIIAPAGDKIWIAAQPDAKMGRTP
jgi:hypothetical protein